MKSILDNSENKVEVNALFLQPTRWCMNNCKDCYVKAHYQHQEEHIPFDYYTNWHEQYKLIEWFALGLFNCHANQITVSLDVKPNEGYKHDAMQALFIYLHYLSLLERVAELHITVHNEDSLKSYIYSAELLPEELKFDMISFSSWNCEKHIRPEFQEMNINYNHLCPTDVNSSNIQKYINHITEVGQYVKSIYMMTRKRPTGCNFSKEQQVDNINRLQQDMSYIKTIINKVPADVKRKIHIDTCIEDVIRSSRTTTGCSCNISKFQIWPDGTVSGCPYAYRGVGETKGTSKGILENIRMARLNYEFTECHLKRSYNHLSRGRSK